MTDPRNAQPGSYGTSGYGADWEQSQTAPDPGKTGARLNRPGAASPAGWFPPAGEAAPPVRLREPARSDEASSYDMETRPTSMYRVPWRPASSDAARHPLRRPQPPVPRPRRSAPANSAPAASAPAASAPAAGAPAAGAPGNGAGRVTSSDLPLSAPDMRWPSLARGGPGAHPCGRPDAGVARPGRRPNGEHRPRAPVRPRSSPAASASLPRTPSRQRHLATTASPATSASPASSSSRPRPPVWPRAPLAMTASPATSSSPDGSGASAYGGSPASTGRRPPFLARRTGGLCTRLTRIPPTLTRLSRSQRTRTRPTLPGRRRRR